MNRRNFLTRSGLALGALIVGDEVLETLDRLTHRKVYALGGVPKPMSPQELVDAIRREFTATLYYGTGPTVMYANKSAVAFLENRI
jgi:hypothetical protein